jgi:hypothetical protein
MIQRNLRLSQRRRNRLKFSVKTLMINNHQSFTYEASHFAHQLTSSETQQIMFIPLFINSTTQTLMLRIFIVALSYFCK